MQLITYLKRNELSATGFAESIGLWPSTITRFLNGERGMGLKAAMRIERATKGKVRVRDLGKKHGGTLYPLGTVIYPRK